MTVRTARANEPSRSTRRSSGNSITLYRHFAECRVSMLAEPSPTWIRTSRSLIIHGSLTWPSPRLRRRPHLTNNAETLESGLQQISARPPVDSTSKALRTTRQAVSAFRSNDPTTATELLRQQGRVYQYAHPDHRIAAVALDYTAQSDRVVIVAPDPAERRELTQLIRSDLREQGKLAAETRTIPVLVEQDYSNAKLAANYSPGDQIHYRTGSPDQEYLTTACHRSGYRCERTCSPIETRDGERFLQSGRARSRPRKVLSTGRRSDLAVGERIQFTAPTDKSHRLR